MPCVWITRSEPGASELAQVLNNNGFEVECAPVIGVRALEPLRVLVNSVVQTTPEAALQIMPSLIVALSGHAVRIAQDTQLLANVDQVPCIAIGEQTAKVLRVEGLQVDTPDEASSEGLLDMPRVQALDSSDTLWVLAGMHGRSMLGDHVRTQQGVRVVKIELYERYDLSPVRITPSTIDAIIVGSTAGLTAAARIWADTGGSLEVALIVPSGRVAGTAKALGFKKVRIAVDASAGACLEILNAMAL